MRIDPWSSEQYEDYGRIIEEFGIGTFSSEGLPDPPILFRRGAIFGQRDFDKILWSIKNNRPWAVLTGLMPSGRMHMGNKMVIDQVLYYQKLGAEIFVAVADIESYGTRDMPLEKARDLSINEFITNYIALGLKPERCQVYFQSKRQEVKDLAWRLAKKINLSEMKAIYDFGMSTNMTHVHAPLIQVGDILHVQLKKHGGPKPTIVPVGIDQDPHMRLTRGVARKTRRYSVIETEDGRFGVFIQRKEDEDATGWLDQAQNILLELGYDKLDRNDNYGSIYLEGIKYDPDLQKEISSRLNQKDYELGGFGVYNPSSTDNMFMTGLTRDKMSSSRPETCIFLTDTPEEAKKKIMSAKTGGAVSLEEQKKSGGKPEECTVYEMLFYHLVEGDGELEEIYEACKDGSRMCGECKKYTAGLMEEFLADLAVKREAAKDKIDEYVVWE